MDSLVVYTAKGCPYCEKLKKGLKKIGVNFNEVRVDLEKNKKIYESLEKVSGDTSVPMMLVNKKHLLVPGKSFNTIEEGVSLIENFKNS